MHDGGYGTPSLMQGLIDRTPHRGDKYVQDNEAVWRLIKNTLEGWDCIKEFEDSEDGRRAYIGIRNHFMGSSYKEGIITAATHTINTSFYDGKHRNFTFEDYCTRMQGAYTDLERHGEKKEHAAQNREFLAGIKDPRLDNAVKTVKGMPERHGTTMNDAIAYMQLFVP